MNKYPLYPQYADDSDYTTNANSYYKDLARKQKLIQELSERIWEYDKTLSDSLENIQTELGKYINMVDGKIEIIDKKIGEGFNEQINTLLEKWVQDGTLDHIINDTLMNKKADIVYVDNMNKLKTYPKYGSIDLSKYEGLNHTINFDLWRDPKDGKIKHSWKLDKTGYVTRYVYRTGSASNDGKTPETPWSNLKYAIDQIEKDSTISHAVIILKGVTTRLMNTISLDTIITKKYIIEAEKPIGSNEWITNYNVYQSTSVVFAPCSYVVRGVVRIDETDVKGNPVAFKNVSSLLECLSTPDSFFYDGTNLYVNRPDTNNSNTVVLVSSSMLQFKLKSNASVILNGITLLSGTTAQACYFESDTTTEGNVICNNVRLINFGVGTNANGISTNGIKDFKAFQCQVYNVVRDGFNYHNTKEVNGRGTVFEYECYAENTGVDTTSSNNNISTAHEGIHIIRVGTKGRKSRGPLIADVNGCVSLIIDSDVYDTRVTGSSGQNSAYYFDDISATFHPTPNGKAWLINCGGGSLTEWGINGDSSFKKQGKIMVDNFRGMNIPNDVILTLFDQ